MRTVINHVRYKASLHFGGETFDLSHVLLFLLILMGNAWVVLTFKCNY